MKLWRRLFRREREGEYVQQIQVLTPDQPLALPPIKPLHAVKQQPAKRVARFEQRMAK